MNLKNNIREILSILGVIGAYATILLLFFIPIPVTNKDLVNISVGVLLGTVLGSTYQYYFGNSKKEIPDNTEEITKVETKTNT